MFFITILINVLVILTILATERDKVTKITFIGFNVAFFFYSCYGIYTYNLDDGFYVSYILSLLVMNICFVFGKRVYCSIYEGQVRIASNSMRGNHYITPLERINDTLTRKTSIIKSLAYVYFAIRVIELFYPEFNLKYLFSGPNLAYDNLLETTRESYGTLLGHLMSTGKTMLLPFAYFYLSAKSNKVVISYFAFDILSQYLVGHASIGRLAIIQVLIVMCLLFYARAKSENEKRKYRIVIIVVGVLCFMLYVFMQNLRSGISISFASINPIQAIQSFAKSEFFYPRNYPMAESLHCENAYPASRFWLWLFTLPIPKSFFSVPGVDTTNSIIYRVFSYHYFGGHWYYEQGVGGMLLSVLGDGIMAYGKYGAWILMIPYAFFLSYYIHFLRNIKNGKLLYYTTFFQFVVSFRPGVQYALTKVNSYIAIIMILFIISHIKAKNSGQLEEL